MKCNGWTNYATWRVFTDLFDGVNIKEEFSSKPGLGQVMEWARERAFAAIENGNPDETRAFFYASAFLNSVNWAEIARYLLTE